MAVEEPQPSSSSSNPMPSSTFSFTAPFPPRSGGASPGKQRRVSLPSSPRFTPASGWSFRDEMGLEAMSAHGTSSVASDKANKPPKTEAASGDPKLLDSIPSLVEKKPRKKWTEEETQMLVEGCNRWGVGNWKIILNDPSLTFDNRSPVDLKDRFRTFFPDAYKQHYPNAKTHLSSKVRASLPDGTSIFEKTRSKKRRPFTPEEDEALKRGYDKHGTLWASILKDPIFQAKNRRSTDLRDRFRNAFPELYEAAGYKPRNNAKKKKGSEGLPVPVTSTPTPAEPADDGKDMSSKAMPRRKRASTAPASRIGRTRRIISSSTPCSDSEENSSGDEHMSRGRQSSSGPTSQMRRRHSEVTPQPTDANERDSSTDMVITDTPAESSTLASCNLSAGSSQASIADFCSSMSQTWPGWDALHSSPSRRPSSGVFLSSQTSPTALEFGRRNTEHTAIGKSAWVTEDWLSPNPRLESSLPDSSSSSFIGGPSPVPSSPFSFSLSAHGVMDRYDLFPSNFATHHNNDFTAASEVGYGDRDTHSAFSEADMFNPATASYRGFTHHSNSAGDLIFAVGRSQPSHFSGSLGLQDRSPLEGINGRRMGLTHSGLPGIDEIPLGAIRLNDRGSSVDTDMDESDIIHSGRTSSPVDEEMSNAPPDLDFHNLTGEITNEILASTPTSMTNPMSPIDLQPSSSISIPKARPLSAHAHQQHLGSSSHFRSFSQPPTDHRTHPGPPHHMHSSPFPVSSSTRSQSVLDNNSAPSSDPWKAPNDLTDLPFLDLHYYTNNTTQQTMALLQDPVVESAQALDLAGWGSGSNASNAGGSSVPSVGIAPALLHTMHTPSENHSIAQAQLQTTPRSPPTVHPHPRPNYLHHQRGQSAVSPDDLLLKKNDNKRKRASWDGGAAS